MANPTTNMQSLRRPTGETGAALMVLGGLAAAFGAASCCALPVLLATLGLGSAWLGGIALLAAPHRPVLLALAATGLVSGFYLLWRQQRQAACSRGAVCVGPAFRGVIMAGLLLGAVLLYLGYAYG
jgi:mercuric ion transport protein